jgi:hypothetical protein
MLVKTQNVNIEISLMKSTSVTTNWHKNMFQSISHFKFKLMYDVRTRKNIRKSPEHRLKYSSLLLENYAPKENLQILKSYETGSVRIT